MKLRRNLIHKVFRRNDIFGVPAIHGVAGKGGVVAKVLSAAPTIFASPVGVMQPRHAHTSALDQNTGASAELFNHADHLMPWTTRRLPRRQLPFHTEQTVPHNP